MHGAAATAVPRVLEAAELQREAEGYAAVSHARRNLIHWSAGYRDGGRAARDTDYPTRLGRPTRALMLARRVAGGLEPWCGAGGLEAAQLSEVQVAEHRGADRRLAGVEAGGGDGVPGG